MTGRAVVPIANMQRRMPEAGRIRIGVKTKGTSKQGKEYESPKALNTFRFTSHDQEALAQVATTYGGTVKPWSDPKAAEGQFEVITEASEIRVVLPPDPLGGTPLYELWGGGGCERRCDGLTAQVVTRGADGAEMVDVPCICAAKEAMACSVITRLAVILPEVRFTGVWRLDSKSWNVAQELPGMVDVIQSLQDRGLTRGVLGLKHRRSVHAGETNRFIVPVLGVDETVEALAAGAARLGALPDAAPVAALGPGAEEGGGIAAQDPAATVAPVGVGNAPAGEADFDDGITDGVIIPTLDELQRRLALLPARAANTARKRARDCSFPQLDGITEISPDMAEGWDGLLQTLEAQPVNPEPITEGQLKKLSTVLQMRGHVGPLRHAFATDNVGREITSLKELTVQEGNLLIDLLEAAAS